MDVKALMDELIEHGCILQSREALAQSIIEKHASKLEKRDIGFPQVEVVDEAEAADGDK